MATPIYLLVLGKGHTEAWFQFSKEEKDALWEKVMAADKRAGAKWLILCKARWADEELLDWGVLEYPSMEAYLQKVDELEELGWWRYFSAKTILGTAWQLPDQA